MTVYGGSLAAPNTIHTHFVVWDAELYVSNDDFFRIPVTNADNTLELEVLPLDCYAEVRVYNNDQTLVYSHTSGSTPANASISNLPVGDVFIQITYDGAHSSHEETDYRMSGVLIEGGVVPLPNNLPTTCVGVDNIESVSIFYETHKHDVLGKVKPSYVLNDSGNVSKIHDGDMSHRKWAGIKILGREVMHPLTGEGGQKYHLTGTLRKENSPFANATLRLYDRATGELMSTTLSDNDGKWRFPRYLRNDHNYYVIAFDDMDSPVLQAVIHDALVPVEV